MLANAPIKGGLRVLAPQQQKLIVGARAPHRVVTTKAQRRDDVGPLLGVGLGHLAAATVAASSLIAVPAAFADSSEVPDAPLLQRYKAVQAEVQGAPAKAVNTSSTTAAGGGIDPVIGAGAAAIALGGAVFVSQQGKKDDGEANPQGTKAIKAKNPPAKPAPAKGGTGSKKVGGSTSIKKGGTTATTKIGTSKIGTSKVGTGTTKKAGTTSTTPKKPQNGVGNKVTQFIDEPPLPAVFAIIAVGAAAGKYALDFTANSVNVKPAPPTELTREQELEIALSLAQRQAATETKEAEQKQAETKAAEQQAAAARAAAAKAEADSKAQEQARAEAAAAERRVAEARAAEQAAEEAARKAQAEAVEAAEQAAFQPAPPLADTKPAPAPAPKPAAAPAPAPAPQAQAPAQGAEAAAPADSPLSNPAVLGVGAVALLGVIAAGASSGGGGDEQQQQQQQASRTPPPSQPAPPSQQQVNMQAPQQQQGGSSDILPNKKEAQEWIARWQAKQQQQK